MTGISSGWEESADIRFKNGSEMKTILVLVDFSRHSNHAARYAFDAATHFNAAILLYNAYYVPNAVTTDGGMFQPYYGDYQEYERESNEKLKALAEELRMSSDFSSGAHVPQIEYLNDLGRIGDNVAGLLEKRDIWFVVMGGKRHIFLDNLLSGSDSSHVLRNVTCPVILVPDKVDFKPFNTVVLASSTFDQHDITALNFVLELVSGTDAEIRIVHVIPEENRAEAGEAEKIDTAIFSKNISFYTIKGRNVEDALLQYVKNYRSDLLVLVHKMYGFMEGLIHHSVIERLIDNHLVPSLIFNP